MKVAVLDAHRSETAPAGLSEQEAAERLKRFGPNELPTAKHRSVFGILLRVLQEPMLLLLVACGAVYLISGSAKDGALLFASAVFVVAITLYQEVKAERALEALKDLSSPRALVIRDGVARRIPGREVVPGDWVQVSEGDRIPADALLKSGEPLSIDESILTGESFSVSKHPEPDPNHQLYSGTLVVSGQGLAVVYATGGKTQLGKIGRSLERGSDEPTALQRELGRWVRVFGFLGVFFSLAVAVIYGLTRGDWAQGILAGLAAAMSLLPEEFPVVMTIFMALGAWRLARKNVLTRRVAAIEALGSISALCVDKTGTLTQNKMAVRKLWVRGEERDLATRPDAPTRTEFFRLLKTAALASNPRPFDPMEKAIFEARAQAPGESAGDLVLQYPLSSGLLAMSCVWRVPGNPHLQIATKGAPEAVVALAQLSREQARLISDQVHRLASQGMRVLGVAGATYPDKIALPEHQQDFDFQFLGLLAFEDPIRPDVPASVMECQRAGIRVIMLTGDYPETARTIGKQLGISEQVISGQELSRLDDLALKQRARTASIFARVSPDQKLRIITALKDGGERVAMTGDGVNDSPSLKWADIGVAMGGRGTDVAREASDIVLLDDRFTSMVAAIHQGRRIYQNLKKAISFILAVHVPIAGLAILPVILKMPLLLLPAHIVFLELIIDPACGLVYEAEEDEAGLMEAPPRPANAPLITSRDFLQAMFQGSAILVLVFSLYWVLLSRGIADGQARFTAYMALILSNLGLILVNRSSNTKLMTVLRHKNKAFNWIAGGALVLLGMIVTIPQIRSLFAFDRLGGGEILVACVTAFLALVLLNLIRKKSHER